MELRAASRAPEPNFANALNVPPANSVTDEDGTERERIARAIAACGGNQTRAAGLLGISRRGLLRRLDSYELPRPRKAKSQL